MSIENRLYRDKEKGKEIGFGGFGAYFFLLCPCLLDTSKVKYLRL